MKLLLLISLATYLLVASYIYFAQQSLIFEPDRKVKNPAPKDWDVPDMQVINLTTQDKLKISVWYKPATGKKPTLLYFQGNAGHIGLWGPMVRPYLDKGFGAVIVTYRGYSGNPGEPSEEGLYKDGRAAIEYLLKDQKINPECLVLYGESLGSGVAVQMAKEYPAAALVLQAPFTSMMDAAHYHYPWLPVKFMLNHRFNSIAKIGSINIPLLLIHGDEDRIVPQSLGKKLFAAAKQPKEAIFYPGVGHNDFPDQSTAVINFLNKWAICD